MKLRIIMNGIGILSKIQITHKYLKRFLPQCHRISTRPSLVGRDFLSPEDFTPEELKAVVWGAADLKASLKTWKKAPDKHKSNITVIMKKPCIISQVAMSQAIQNLGFNAQVVDAQMSDMSSYIFDLGRALSMFTKLIVAVGFDHQDLKLLSDGASIPVVNFYSSVYQPVHCLANLLTIQEHYGFLRNLKMGWIGPWDSTLNTYLIICPKFGMDIQFATTDDAGNYVLKRAVQCAIEGGTDVAGKSKASEAIYRVHVIATSLHCNETMKITRKLVSEAAVNWTLVPNLPRSHIQVTDDVFYSRNNLLWKSCENLVWVSTAVLLHLLQEFNFTIPRPDFEGCNVSPEKYYQR